MNEELNNQLGNLVLRVINMINKDFEGVIPEPKELSGSEVSLLDKTTKARKIVEEHMSKYRFQRALVNIMELIRDCNALLNLEEPWKKVKVNKHDAGNTLYVSAFVLKAAGIMLLPFIPDSATKMLKYLGLNPERIEWRNIATSFNEGRRVVKEPKSIFAKIETHKLIEKLAAIRGEEVEKEVQLIDIQDFSKLDIRVGEIVEAEPIEGRDKLLKLSIRIGEEVKTSIAGLAKQYTVEELVGRQVITLTNLKPREIAGITSEVMLLAVPLESDVSLLVPDKRVPVGSKIS